MTSDQDMSQLKGDMSWAVGSITICCRGGGAASACKAGADGVEGVFEWIQGVFD